MTAEPMVASNSSIQTFKQCRRRPKVVAAVRVGLEIEGAGGSRAASPRLSRAQGS
jgi:hypothetical protein